MSVNYDLTESIFTAGALAALAYGGRSIIERWLSRDLERYKAELKATNDREFERLRTDLKLATFEHETRFAKLHERRAEVIAELHKRLVQAERSFSSMESSEEKKSKTAINNVNEFWSYFEEHRIYLNGDLCAQIARLHQTFHEAYTELVTSPTRAPGSPNHFDLFAQLEAWGRITKEIPQLRQDIENDFRKMLGVDQTNDSV